MDNESQTTAPTSSNSAPAPSSREWKLIEKLLASATIEQRRTRRWGIFFKALTFLYLFVLLIFMTAGFGSRVAEVAEPHTALIDVKGVIAADENASADSLVTGLRAAFESENVKGVVLRINSPGGSPVQSGYVYDEIKRLRAERPEIKVYAVIADLGASGAYYIAAAADEIYADKSSLVGSIGVIAAGFGFVQTLDKLGVERRVYTSGQNKNFLDPFMPEQPEHVAYWKQVLDSPHEQFIAQVKAGRGDRLKDDPALFSGLIWSGEQALELGLIDGFGSSSYVAREVVGAETLVDYTPARSPFEKLAREFGASVGQGLGSLLMSAQIGLR